jgi:hypothetical protein
VKYKRKKLSCAFIGFCKSIWHCVEKWSLE